MMKRLNFKEFSMPSGISRTNWLTVDVREQVADLLYTHANGIKPTGWPSRYWTAPGKRNTVMKKPG